jgi:hypothetical protein
MAVIAYRPLPVIIISTLLISIRDQAASSRTFAFAAGAYLRGDIRNFRVDASE